MRGDPSLPRNGRAYHRPLPQRMHTVDGGGGVARRLLRYVAGLIIGQGRHAGQPFTVLPWQKRFILGAFGQPDDAALSLGRGTGKTTLIAAIGAACVDVDGPLVEPNAESVIVASSFDQALIGFRHTLHFLRPTFEAHKRRFRVQDSANRATIQDRETGAMLRVLGSDPRRVHGIAPKLIIGDEISQWPDGRIDAMLAALSTSLGKIPGSRSLWIGTRPSKKSHQFARILAGDLGYRQVHAAGPDDPPFRRRTWVKANPGLDHLPDLEIKIRKHAREAKNDEAALQTFRALRLNQGVSDVLESVLLSTADWERVCGRPVGDNEGQPVVGMDLGEGRAWSAAVALYPSGRIEAIAVANGEISIEDAERRDRVPAGVYRRLFNSGVVTTDGVRRVPRVEVVIDRIRQWRPAVIVCDRFRLDSVIDARPPCPIVPRRLMPSEWTADIRALRQLAADGPMSCAPESRALVEASLSVSEVRTDESGCSKLIKHGQRNTSRDDVSAALTLAAGARSRAPTEPTHAYHGLV